MLSYNSKYYYLHHDHYYLYYHDTCYCDTTSFGDSYLWKNWNVEMLKILNDGQNSTHMVAISSATLLPSVAVTTLTLMSDTNDKKWQGSEVVWHCWWRSAWWRDRHALRGNCWGSGRFIKQQSNMIYHFEGTSTTSVSSVAITPRLAGLLERGANRGHGMAGKEAIPKMFKILNMQKIIISVSVKWRFVNIDFYFFML